MQAVAIVLFITTFLLAAVIIIVFSRGFFVKKPIRVPKEEIELLPERYAETLSDMIKFETVATKGQPTPYFREFLDYIKGRFPAFIKACDVFEIESSFVIKWKGRESEKSTVLMSHYDVAPIKTDWTVAPFSGLISEGKVFGRGSIDAKGTLCALLEACDKLFGEGYVPENDIFILSTGNEEVDGGDMEKVVEQFGKMNAIPRLVVDEGGAIMNNVLQTEHRGARISWSERSSCKFVVKGDKISSKRNSMSRLAKFISKVDSKKLLKAHYPREFKEMIEETLPYMEYPQKVLFKNGWLFKNVIRFFLPKIYTDAFVMVYPTVSFQTPREFDCNKLAYGENAVEGVMMCSAYADFTKAMNRLHKIAVRCGVRLEVSEVKIAPKAQFNIEQSYKLVKNSIEKTFDDVIAMPVILQGNTDSTAFSGHCDNILGFSPLSLSDEQASSVHFTDENVDISALTDAVACYYHLMKTL